MGTVTPIRRDLPAVPPVLFDHEREAPSPSVLLSQVEAKAIAGLLRACRPPLGTAPHVHQAVNDAIALLGVNPHPSEVTG